MFRLLLLLPLLTVSTAKPRVAAEDPNVPSLTLHCLESEALSFLGAEDVNEAYCGKTIRQVMERGWWELTAKLVKECRARDFKVAGPVYKAKSNLNKQLNIITNLLSGPSAIISPAFQWSQSKDYILFNVKFAHKLDTPATLGVKSKGADIKSGSLTFEAASKSKNKRFKLSLKLAREIIPEESEWSMAAVGRATFSLKKKHPETAWVKLLHISQTAPQNMHTWWAMKEQHENVVKSLKTSLTDTSAIKMAQAQNNNNSSTEATAETTTNNEAAAAAGVATAASSADAAPTSDDATDIGAVNPNQASLDLHRQELEKEKAIARENILKKAKSSSEEIDDRFRQKKSEIDNFAMSKKDKLDFSASEERTKIQRNKADALLTLEKVYEEKMRATEL